MAELSSQPYLTYVSHVFVYIDADCLHMLFEGCASVMSIEYFPLAILAQAFDDEEFVFCSGHLLAQTDLLGRGRHR